MANKSRLLYLLKYLLENTDEEMTVSSVDLRTLLEANGFKADNRTVRDDMEMIRDSGLDIHIIERNGVPTRYYFGKRQWETTELKIIIDALSSSQFISNERCNDLIQRLTQLAGISAREYLKPNVFVSQRRKSSSDMLLNIVQAVNSAIRENKKIEFRYYSYDLKKERVYRHRGEKYVMSPYATVWKDDRYYLVGYSDKRKKVVTFRVDRMAVPKLINEDRVPEPADFSVKAYSETIFRMYDGPTRAVTLHCHRGLIDQIIDRFGRDVKLENITESTFDVTAEVAVSGTFFAWVFQYMGDMTVLGPEDVAQEYAFRLEKALHNVQKGTID